MTKRYRKLKTAIMKKTVVVKESDIAKSIKPVMTSVEIDDRLKRIAARLTTAEKRFLWEAVSGLPEGAICVEVGTEKGGSSRVLVEANPYLKVFTVDYNNAHKERLKFLKYRFRRFLDRIEFIPFKSCERKDKHSNIALHTIRTLLQKRRLRADFVFIDGDHRTPAVVEDINAYISIVKPGGFFCGHDCHRHNPKRTGMLRIVTKMFKERNLPVYFFDRFWYVVMPY